MVITWLRNRVFARVNGSNAVPVPGELVGLDEFLHVYEHPAANGRSRGAALSDLFWYWLAPGPQVHQEHLEPGARYADVARTTRHILAHIPADELAGRCAARNLRPGLTRLRDLMMPIWAEFYYEAVFGEPCPRHARDLIVANANDVVTALKCTGLRHMARRDRLTAYLLDRLDDVPHRLPESLSRQEQAWYLQGTFFNTAVVQSSEAMAHLLLVIAETRQDIDTAMDEAFRRFPLFGIAHRITSADIELARGTIPRGSVLCFDYAAYHAAGLEPIPFGVSGNRPCPARVQAPAAMRVVAREVIRRYDLYSSAAHTRPLPNRGPCVLVPRASPEPKALLVFMRLRDRWENVWRGVGQLVLGTYMVWDARRSKLCQRHFGG